MSKQPPLHVPAAPQSKIQVPPQAPQGPIWLQHLCKPPPSSWPGSSLCTALLLTHRQAQAQPGLVFLPEGPAPLLHVPRPGLVFLPEGSAPLLHLPRPGLVFLSEGPGSLLPLPQPGLVSLSEGPGSLLHLPGLVSPFNGLLKCRLLPEAHTPPFPRQG